MKTSTYIIGGWILALVLVIGFFVFNAYIYNEKQGEPSIEGDHKNTTYIIDGKSVRLVDGKAETDVVSGSASKITTTYFGNELKKDLNGDGREDIVFLLTQTTGGSGTFFYVVAAIAHEQGYTGSQATFLGDRIAPQTTESGTRNSVIINYADRAEGEDFGMQPTLGKSLYLIYDEKNNMFGELVQNFEGEADPSRMKLPMKTWNWIEASINNGDTIKPKKAVFTITFTDDGNVSVTTDCNRIQGRYSAEGGSLTFSSLAMTKMFCEGTQESVFTQLLQDTTSYHFTSKGELIFDLKFDSGTVLFR